MNGFFSLLIIFELFICIRSTALKQPTTVIPKNYLLRRSSEILEGRNDHVQSSVSTVTTEQGLPDPSSYVRDRRSINGSIVDDHAYRYIVSLHYKAHGHRCGGTILHPKLILTAAHCFRNKTSRPTHIIVSKGDGFHKTIVRVDDYISHELFNKSTLAHDIGILVLESSIPNPEIVQLAREDTHLPNGTIVTAYGWGRTVENGSVSERLRYVGLPISKDSDCARHYSNARYRICTGTREAATCKGDSGGPLMMGKYQIGIVSGFLNSCTSGLPAASTKVAYYQKWIDKKIWSLKQQKVID